MEFVATGVFILIVIFSFASRAVREKIRSRTAGEWILDGIGLLNQGFIAGLAVGWLISQLLTFFFPNVANTIEVSGLLLFVTSLLTFDYVFYWSHRLFHRSNLFAVHFIHHTSTNMDVFATSRNTLWQPLLFPNVWLISLTLWVSANPTPIILAIEVLAIFDFWNHSSLHLPKYLQKHAQNMFITPAAHEWHHSLKHYRNNFGNVFSIWDRIHNTYYNPGSSPERVGLPHKDTWWKMLVFPVGRKR